MMKQKEVERIQGGEILASPIVTDSGEILLQKGTVIRQEYGELLQSLNIASIMVENQYDRYLHPEYPLADKDICSFQTQIKSLLQNHLYTKKGYLKHSMTIAEQMWEQICEVNPEKLFDIPTERTDYLSEHTFWVTVMALLLAEKSGFSREQSIELAAAGILHDLGLRYITVPYENKAFDRPELTDAAEAFEYKKHTILAYTVLEQETWLSTQMREIILSHHEKMDGSGFPLKQKNQSDACKIIQLCDTFDCLISGMECVRIPADHAMDLLADQAGIRYEEKFIRQLFSSIARYPVGTEVLLSDGSYAIVSRQTQKPENPVVMRLTSLHGDIIVGEEYDLSMHTDIHIVQTAEI